MDTHRIPAHMENGSVHLDAPLPPSVERIEVVAYTASVAPKRTLSEYILSLPPGTMTGDQIDAEIREIRDGW